MIIIGAILSLIVYCGGSNLTEDSLIKFKLDLEKAGTLRVYHFYFPIAFALSGYVVSAALYIISMYFTYMCVESLKHKYKV